MNLDIITEVELKKSYNIIFRNCFLLWGKNLFTPVKTEKKPDYYKVSIAIHDNNPDMEYLRSIHKLCVNKYGSQMSKYHIYKAFPRGTDNRLSKYFDIANQKMDTDPTLLDLFKTYNLTTRIDDYNAFTINSYTNDFFVTSPDGDNTIRHFVPPTPDIFNAGALVDISFYLYYYEGKEYNLGDTTKSKTVIKNRCELESIHLVSPGISELYKDLPAQTPTAGMEFNKQPRFGIPAPVQQLELRDTNINIL